MDWKLELIPVPGSDIDRAKAFYVDQVGFTADHDVRVREGLRFVQLTPPVRPARCASGRAFPPLSPAPRTVWAAAS